MICTPRSASISVGNSACRRWRMPTHVEFWNWGTHNLISRVCGLFYFIRCQVRNRSLVKQLNTR
jgi:hypothetical protein